MKIRHVALASALILAAPPAAIAAGAQWGQWDTRVQAPAYREGYERGVRAGEEDGRRNQSFNYTDESDYRNGTAGYRSQYGNRDRYRDEFRRGYAEGYRLGYARDRDGYDDGSGRWGRGRGGVPPPWANGRGRGGYGQADRYDLAFSTGYNDGYEAGLKDGRDRRRNNPIDEGRYRDGDRGYERQYGSRETYKIRYREAFRQGYERGYQDARRYEGGRSWWPFGR